MERRTGKVNRVISAGAAILAAAVCAAAVFLFFRAGELPVGAGEEPARILEECFARLESGDRDGAAELIAGDGDLVPEPEDYRAAMLWNAQRAAWQLEVLPEYGQIGPDLARRAAVTAPDLRPLRDEILAGVQSRLEAALDAATLKSEIYDDTGAYRSEVVFSCLDETLEELSRDLGPYGKRQEVTVRLAFEDGQWRAVAEGELISALTGGAIRAADALSGEQITEEYEQFVNNLISSALEGLVAVPKIYRLPENTVVAPAPDPDLFGQARTAPEALAALRDAPLRPAGELMLTEDTQLLPYSRVSWYSDETILAVTWQQRLDNMTFTFCEVAAGHPSQMRRYLSDNDFHSFKRYTPTRMAAAVNAVAALSGDFYQYRGFGIVVYQGEVYRSDGALLDTCFVDRNGDLLFVRAGELTDEEAIRRYVAEHDVSFSLAFGPVMIEEGKNVVPPGKYPIGQIQENYSRCVLCQLGECHYLLVTVSKPLNPVLNLSRIADVLVSLGVPRAYTLDGGQTASLILNNELMNQVDFGEERNMSDIIYFASAIPEEGR